MFSDTHFHFNILREDENFTRRNILQKMKENGCKFALDIGVRAEDLPLRQKLFKTELSELQEEEQTQIKDFLYFSAGIWPDPDSIRDRKECLAVLEKNIQDSKNGFFAKKLVALGECGLDHHWNPAGADGRDENDFDRELLLGEKELFEAQLKMAERFNLPVIVHSRDAAAQTLECIKNAGYNKGVIHCYSYGVQEAREFLSLGWHISFSGSVTYTKKAKAEEMRELLRLVPDDKILVETDAPYLAPVPLRGRPNNPTYIEHTYRYIAEARGCTVEELCAQVEQNAERLFLS